MSVPSSSTSAPRDGGVAQTWMQRWVGPWWVVSAVVIIALVCTVGATSANVDAASPVEMVWTAVAVPVIVVAVLLNKRFPQGSVVVVGAALTLALCDASLRTHTLPPLCVSWAAWAVAFRCSARWRRFFATWMVAGVLTALGLQVAATRQYLELEFSAGVLVAALLDMGFFWLLGRTMRRRREDLAALRAKAELAGVLERTRIAREMHDIVAHSLSGVIAVADGARFAAAKNPDVAVEALATISEASRQALGQMRGLLSVLREDSPRQTHSAPGVAELASLVTDAQRAGLVVEVTGLDTVPRQLPELTQLTVYRTLQELLTNMLRYATARSGQIHIDGSGNPIRIESRNGVAPPARQDGSGFGLVGMRERVRAGGGRVTTQRTEDEFVVIAEVAW
ncbi:sensor histidine kinase [Corynebacterium uberis]|uniref:sensor histidine kinase n=1 Tax=Corynebacterium TaxID=1716 RepID=UPI001D0A2660|nr:histidine kinase [Corynebacterium uberis]MCZ9308438.1 histidine kinase [Corynebacterium sp. c6VSa_13]UDL74104.1 histidine kinase [Corynebacterium uberis]UDL75012.1 histidine kinase [Corynebacterium uberis]UDL77227.1 histidine kinase [Corynebacterium uberis]UDL79509.1 histidine kinase [Corynebacterium uberis]